MAADAYEAWVASCDDCDWASDEWYESRLDADRAADRHNEFCPHLVEDMLGEDPHQEWLDSMDAIVEAIRAR